MVSFDVDEVVLLANKLADLERQGNETYRDLCRLLAGDPPISPPAPKKRPPAKKAVRQPGKPKPAAKPAATMKAPPKKKPAAKPKAAPKKKPRPSRAKAKQTSLLAEPEGDDIPFSLPSDVSSIDAGTTDAELEAQGLIEKVESGGSRVEGQNGLHHPKNRVAQRVIEPPRPNRNGLARAGRR